MRYEVTWKTHEDDEQVFTSMQFKTLEEAVNVFMEKKEEFDVEHVRVVKILYEYSV